MELWRTEGVEQQRPEVLGARNIGVALALHVGALLAFLCYSVVHGFFDKKEEVVPIDLTVVVNENLDGVENEPPPLQKPEPPPPPPKPEPPKPKAKPKEPEKPKELEKIVTNIVEKVEKKKEEPPKPEEKKVEKPKKPEPPKKTAKELREERKRRARESARVVNKKVTIVVENAPSGNGRTSKKTLSDAEIRKLLNQGYRPGTTEQLATSEEQRCVSLIRMAFEAKWDKPAWTDTIKPMVLNCRFGAGGRLLSYNLQQSSGDRAADQSILVAAKRVVAVSGLSPKFIEKYRNGIPVRFTVKPQ